MPQFLQVQYVPTKGTRQEIVLGIVIEVATIEERGLDERRF